MQVQIQKANVFNVYKLKHTMQMQKLKMSKDKYKHAFALSPMELNQGAKISTSVLPFFRLSHNFTISIPQTQSEPDDGCIFVALII